MAEGDKTTTSNRTTRTSSTTCRRGEEEWLRTCLLLGNAWSSLKLTQQANSLASFLPHQACPTIPAHPIGNMPPTHNKHSPTPLHRRAQGLSQMADAVVEPQEQEQQQVQEPPSSSSTLIAPASAHPAVPAAEAEPAPQEQQQDQQEHPPPSSSILVPASAHAAVAAAEATAAAIEEEKAASEAPRHEAEAEAVPVPVPTGPIWGCRPPSETSFSQLSGATDLLSTIFRFLQLPELSAMYVRVLPPFLSSLSC